MQILSLLLCVLPLLARGQAPTLDSLKDRNRVLLVFAAASQDTQSSQQKLIFHQHEAAMKERDLVLMAVPAGSADLRTRFRVAPRGFTVILVGKDGGEKMRTHQPIPAEKLEQTIDAMPMRQDEMRR
jgi:hypothetical protein